MSLNEVKNDISLLYEAVWHVLNSDKDYVKLCRERAELLYNDDLMVRRYINLNLHENSI